MVTTRQVLQLNLSLAHDATFILTKRRLWSGRGRI